MRIAVNDYSLMNRRLLPELEAAFREVVVSGGTEVYQVPTLEKEMCLHPGARFSPIRERLHRHTVNGAEVLWPWA